jgi:hypothetical protein
VPGGGRLRRAGEVDSCEWSLFAEGETGLDTQDPFGIGLDRGALYPVGLLADRRRVFLGVA